jgi:hypothetical protein
MRIPAFRPSQLLLLIALALPLPSSARAADYFPPPDRDGGWRTLKDPA